MVANLSHTELVALRDDAHKHARHAAEEWSRDHGGKEGKRLRRELLAAMYVYGACERREGDFHSCNGLREVGEESVEVEFSEAATAFLRALRDEYRAMLEDQRASVELCENSVGIVFVVFVLDGLFKEADDRG